MDRLVKTEFLSNPFDILGHSIASRHNGCGISRRKVKQEKNKNGYHPHNGDGSQKTSNNVSPHPRFDP
jgi:hypothetical protein